MHTGEYTMVRLERCMTRSSFMSRLLPVFLSCVAAVTVLAQTPAAPPPAALTADHNRQNMMDQLDIKALRPGPSGNEKAPNHADYDESKANPFPEFPDPLILQDGQKVTTPAMWWDQRRPELIEMYSRYVYGRVPRDVPKVTWTVKTVDHEMIGFTPVLAREVIGEVDNSSYPAITVNIRMMLVTPEKAKGPMPVLVMFGRAGFPAPNEPQGADLDRINKAMKALLVQQDLQFSFGKRWQRPNRP
jgi:hypothetical protein